MNLIERTQIHGLKFLSKSKHRWFWALLLITYVICCILLLYVWMDRFLKDPTYIVLLQPHKSKNLFPAVIVCPEIAFPNDKIEKFIKNLVYPRNNTEEYLRAHIQQLAAFFSPDVFYRLDDLEIIENVLDYNKVDVETAGLNLTASCEESISRCRWGGHFLNCTKLFKMVLTTYGFCCMFNGRYLKRDLTELESVPAPPNYRINKNLDFTGGLMLVVNQSLATPFDVDISYKWLSLHGNQRFVNLPGNGTPITPGTELHAGFIPNMLRVDEDAANLDRDQKRCRMSYEALEYFPVYHKQHCLMEIEMRRTIELCGCLKLGHLHVPGVPVCRARSLQCARLASGKQDFNYTITISIYLCKRH
ncbi:PREDICTED: sodium channel protein Nach-like [Papilio xuthus]|uniref:Sodium channel protein Nach-like n=1 Tax=Papilio xuthus TaxID=66420 RepID=A0AAJ6YYP0_PAPXU|nr:PREDICTED: sodium channel protein Nach-like [Papilio xuthus]